jgi:uncharacterized membrane protein
MDTIIPPSQAATAATVPQHRTVAIISYLTIVGFIAAIVMHQSTRTELGAFHLRQMFGLVLTAAAGSLLAVVPILGWIVWIVLVLGIFVLWALGLLAALRGEAQPCPIVGAHYQRWFARVFS